MNTHLYPLVLPTYRWESVGRLFADRPNVPGIPPRVLGHKPVRRRRLEVSRFRILDWEHSCEAERNDFDCLTWRLSRPPDHLNLRVEGSSRYTPAPRGVKEGLRWPTVEFLPPLGQI